MLSERRMLTIDSDYDIIISDNKDNTKEAFFTGKRFALLIMKMPDINREVTKAKDEKYVDTRLHIGCAWYLSITSGFHCVDIRKFFKDSEGNIRATKRGISLSYSEWDRLMNVATRIENEIEAFKAISNCWHDSQIELQHCRECNPFDE